MREKIVQPVNYEFNILVPALKDWGFNVIKTSHHKVHIKEALKLFLYVLLLHNLIKTSVYAS